MTNVVTVLVNLAGIYLLAGLIFGLVFVFGGGVQRIDPGAKDGSWGFRIFILPGCAVFWPYLLQRWRKRTPPPEERSAHRTR